MVTNVNKTPLLSRCLSNVSPVHWHFVPDVGLQEYLGLFALINICLALIYFSSLSRYTNSWLVGGCGKTTAVPFFFFFMNWQTNNGMKAVQGCGNSSANSFFTIKGVILITVIENGV